MSWNLKDSDRPSFVTQILVTRSHVRCTVEGRKLCWEAAGVRSTWRKPRAVETWCSVAAGRRWERHRGDPPGERVEG